MNKPGVNDSQTSSSGDDPERSTAALVAILDDYLAEIKAGTAPTRDEWLARHPHLASQLEACLAGLDFIHAHEQPSLTELQTLGDFRILSEVGRGGMGAVYKAEQLTLRRVVALKVLRFAAVSNKEAIERFRRETETVAALHHTNIVPIFAVGSEQGINYYAMQFIEGRSLAEVAAQSAGPLPAESVAEWGLQAAEALAHAHQRAVIHRDVKPSNLLLDNENRVWLTDFGLAQRMDDATLSLTGVLLGTPRYMSPEQATASGKRLDHRSDIFSLGATLYELLSGQPAFAGHTPHTVIQNILQCEPIPLRRLVPNLPRDLETIVMKCLAKEPVQRYGDARSLAEDLRAMLDGRPIGARRAGPIVVARQWLQKRRNSVYASTLAVTATIAAGLLAVAGWSTYTTWNRATVRFDATRPPLAAAILDAQGRLIHAETAPMQAAATLPAGHYQVRASGGPLLSQTFEMTVDRGENATYPLNLDEQLLWEPQQIERGFALIDLKPVSPAERVDQNGRPAEPLATNAKHALAIWTDQGLRLQHATDRMADWTAKLDDWQPTIMQAAPGFRWPWNGSPSSMGGRRLQPTIANRSIDADSDGVGDLICAGRNQAWLAVVSGRTGSLLWIAARGTDLLKPAAANSAAPLWLTSSAVIGDPVVGHDCDGDGVGDIIATMLDAGSAQAIRQNQLSARRWIEAISGKTGETIWTFELPEPWFELTAGEEVPYHLRWFSGMAGGQSTLGSTTSNVTAGQLSRDRARVVQTGVHVYRPAAAQLATLHGRTQVVVVGGRHAVAIDPASGTALRPAVDTGHRVAMPPQWADVDGDGSDDLVLLVPGSSSSPHARDLARVAVWSLSLEATLWSAELDASCPSQPNWIVAPPRWPLVSDLDGDGRAEIVVPKGRSSDAVFEAPRKKPWGAIAVLQGDTGRTLWQRRIVCMDRQIDHFVAGPDLDDDGHAEIFAVSLAGREAGVYVDALSGANGQTIWTAHQSLRSPDPSRSSTDEWFTNTRTSLAPPQWWRAGRDGWPHLLVHVFEGGSEKHASQLLAFSAGTGRLSHTAYDATQAMVADLDGDALDELLAYVATVPEAPERGGKLYCIRGVSGEPWRRLGSPGTAVADLDGDSVIDLVRSTEEGLLIATSGRQGRELWRSRASQTGAAVQFTAAETPAAVAKRHSRNPASAASRSSGDLDGDGVVDLLVWHDATFGETMPPFAAVSGRTGQVLWTARDIPASIIGGVATAEACDLDADGEPEVVWLAGLNYGYPDLASFSIMDVQLRVFVCSGRTGRLQWTQALSPAYGQLPGSVAPFHLHHVRFPLVAADLNADSVQDLILPLVTQGDQFAYAALDGNDGRFLWRRQRGADLSPSITLDNWISPVACDLDGDDRHEVIIVQPTSPDADGQLRSRVSALNGSNGQALWSHRTESRYAPRQSFTDPSLARLQPAILRASGGGCRVGVFLPGQSGRVAVFGEKGLTAERSLAFSTEDSGLWNVDIEGDGIDELAFLDGPTLYLTTPDRLNEPLWQRAFGFNGQQQILAVTPAAEDRPRLLKLATSPTDNSVLGLDLRDGSTVWNCPGPILRGTGGNEYLTLQAITLLGGKSNEMPYVFYALGSAAICRQAALVESGGDRERDRSLTASLTSRDSWGVSRASVIRTADRPDERWLRDLPWSIPRDAWRESAQLVGWSLGFSLMLIVVPGSWLLRMLARRRFNLRQLLALPLIAALFLLATLDVSPPQLHSFDRRLLAAAAFTPLVVLIAVLGRRFAQRRWRSVLVWLIVSLMITIAIAAAMLYQVRADLSPGERYDWSGWPAAWLPGVYITAWLALVCWTLKRLGGGLIRSTGVRRRRRPSTDNSAAMLPSTLIVKPAPARQPEGIHAEE